MRKQYKFLSLVLTVIMVVSCLSLLNTSVLAEEVSDGFIYRVQDGNAVLCGLENTVSGDVVVPQQLGGYNVTMIDGAFKNKFTISSVTLPDTVTVIAKDSFNGCSLSTICLSNNLTRIDEAAFSACVNLMAIEMPDSLKTLGPYAFSWCSSLKTVVFSNNLSLIDSETFNGCSELEEINIPDSVSYISSAAFSGTKYYNTQSNWTDGVLYLGNHIIAANKSAVSGRCVIREGTRSISNFTFIRCVNLTEVVFPLSLKKIGESAFMFCDNLEHVLYCGTVDQRRSITIEKNNTSLLNVTWHYGFNPDETEYYPGDINGDGSVNNKDVTRLFQYLTGWEVEVQPAVLDVNGDKEVNNKDITRLFQYLSDWDVKIYSSSTNFDYSGEDSGPIISF